MNNLPKVIFVCYSLAVGGAERRIAAISSKLAERGVQVKILLLDSPKVVFDVHPQVEVIYLGEETEGACLVQRHAVQYYPVTVPPIGFGDKLKLKIAKFFHSKKADVLEQEFNLRLRYAYRLYAFLKNYPDWGVIPFMTFANLASMMAVAKLPNMIAFGECTSPAFEFSALHPMNILKHRWYLRANAGIFQTEEESDFYTYLSCRKYVIPNPLFGDYPERFEGKRRKEIVSFCRLSKMKNIPLLLEAFRQISNDYPEYTLSIYGEGEEKEHLLEIVDKLSLKCQVIFHDFDVALHEKIKDCAMFVSSSDREGISNSMLEAMAIGLPCVCTDCPAGGARMMIQDHENGLLVPVRDKDALYKAMVELIEHPELGEKFSRNSVKIKERLHIDRITDAWLSAIQEIANS